MISNNKIKVVRLAISSDVGKEFLIAKEDIKCGDTIVIEEIMEKNIEKLIKEINAKNKKHL